MFIKDNSCHHPRETTKNGNSNHSDFMRLRFPATKPTQHPACQPRCRPRWASSVGLWRVPSCPCSLLRRLSCGLQGREPWPWGRGGRLEPVGACLPILSLWRRRQAGFAPKRKAQLLQPHPHSFSQVPSGLRGGTAHQCPQPPGHCPPSCGFPVPRPHPVNHLFIMPSSDFPSQLCFVPAQTPTATLTGAKKLAFQVRRQTRPQTHNMLPHTWFKREDFSVSPGFKRFLTHSYVSLHKQFHL